MNDAEWARVKPWIESALYSTHGTHKIEDIEAGLKAGDYQLWTSPRAAIVTQICVTPQLSLLNFWLVGGDLHALLEMEPGIVAWAKNEHGCSLVLQLGRDAWARILKPLGYRAGMTMLTKEI